MGRFRDSRGFVIGRVQRDDSAGRRYNGTCVHCSGACSKLQVPLRDVTNRTILSISGEFWQTYGHCPYF